jgi:hypothetical protein
MYALMRAFGIGSKEARKLAYAPIADPPAPRGAIFERVDALADDDGALNRDATS